MQALLGGFPSIMNPTLKVEESQLLELSCKAKKAPDKEGFLCKVDVKGKKVSEKWCLVYRNLMFYYEPASCNNKPTGVIMLEGCHSYQAVVAEVTHSDCPPNYDTEVSQSAIAATTETGACRLLHHACHFVLM